MNRKATRIVRRYVSLLGLGVHPDTRGADYVDSAGKRVFSDDEAAQYDRDIAYLFTLGDAYAMFIDEWERRGIQDIR